MANQTIYYKTAKGRAYQRLTGGDVSLAQLEALKLIDGKTCLRDLTGAMTALDKANFLVAIQALLALDAIRAGTDGLAGDSQVPDDWASQASDAAIDVVELEPQESVMAWAAATRGTRELQEQGYFSNPMRQERETAATERPNLQALVVDDDVSIVELLTASLEEIGYAVSSALTAENAVAMLAKMAVPDLVLLDVQLPKRNGFQILGWIRANPKLAKVPVIMVTAMVDHASVMKGLRYGADGYIFKPLRWEKLHECIRTVVGR